MNKKIYFLLIGGAYTTPNGGVKSIRVWVLN